MICTIDRDIAHEIVDSLNAEFGIDAVLIDPDDPRCGNWVIRPRDEEHVVDDFTTIAFHGIWAGWPHVAVDVPGDGTVALLAYCGCYGED